MLRAAVHMNVRLSSIPPLAMFLDGVGLGTFSLQSSCLCIDIVFRKTTTMTFKIYGIERTVRARSNELERKPRQLFVTQSRVLANRVKDYYDKLSGQLSASGLPSESTSDDPSQTVPDGLGDPDEEDEWRDELPKRFSELEDRHFPLFLTFDKVGFRAKFSKKSLSMIHGTALQTRGSRFRYLLCKGDIYKRAQKGRATIQSLNYSRGLRTGRHAWGRLGNGIICGSRQSGKKIRSKQLHRF